MAELNESAELGWIVRNMPQGRLHEAFIGPHRDLRRIKKFSGFTGARAMAPDGTIMLRARAYAKIHWDCEWVHCAGGMPYKLFRDQVEQRLVSAAAAMGQLWAEAMAGDQGPDENVWTADDAAKVEALGFSTGMLGRVNPVAGRDVEGLEFWHLAPLPHIWTDDGFNGPHSTTTRRGSYDAIEVRMRSFGNVVPVGTVIPE